MGIENTSKSSYKQISSFTSLSTICLDFYIKTLILFLNQKMLSNILKHPDDYNELFLLSLTLIDRQRTKTPLVCVRMFS